jgi:hypothetical protein
MGKGAQMKIQKTNKQYGALGSIKILAERKVSYSELDIDVDDNTFHKIAKAGLIEIKRDKKALFNYALLKAFEEFCGNGSS